MENHAVVCLSLKRNYRPKEVMNSYHYINPYRPQHPFQLTDKQRSFLNSWEKKRKGSRPKFYFINGFLKNTSWIFIFQKLIQFLSFNEATVLFYKSTSGLLFLLVEILFWLFCGVVIGWMNYISRESRFELFKSMRHF